MYETTTSAMAVNSIYNYLQVKVSVLVEQRATIATHINLIIQLLLLLFCLSRSNIIRSYKDCSSHKKAIWVTLNKYLTALKVTIKCQATG